MTAVEKYLNAKGIQYYLDGNNAIIQCPVCKQDEGQCGINIDSYLWNCFRGKCAAKGNEVTFKRIFGDVVEQKSNLDDDVTTVPATRAQSANSIEPIPDVEAAHQKLLENDEILNWLNDERGFSLEAVKAAKLGLGLRKFGNKSSERFKTIESALMFPYFDGDKCVGVKYRSLPPTNKDFKFTAGREVGLYRQNAIKKDMEALILAEGESDTLALVNQGIDYVVGVPGCEGKKVSWDDKLNLPKKMYLVYDNDEAGQKGALAFATRFGVERFHNVVIPQHPLMEPIGERTTVKDINDFFMAGHTLEEFQELLDKAKPFDMEGITSMEDAFDEIIAEYEQRGNLDLKYKFKWDSVNSKAKGIDDSDLIIVLAPRKTGKTTFVLNQLEYMLTTYGINIHFECLEMSPKQLTKKWAAMFMDVDEDSMTIEQFKEAQRLERARPNHFYFSQSCPKNEDEAMDIMRKTARRYAIGAAAFDNLQLLVDTVITRADRPQRPAFISSITKKFKRLAGELKYPLFLISQPKNVQDGEMVSGTDSEGSGAPANDCDLFITLNRDREAKMKMAQMASLGKFETNQSHSSVMYVETAFSRRSSGGVVTLKMDGEKSLIREYSDDERKATTKQGMIGSIAFHDDNEKVDI